MAAEGGTPFERLEPTAALSAWREVRLDLSGHAGHEVWIVLAVREEGERRGDWLLWGDPRIRIAGEEALSSTSAVRRSAGGDREVSRGRKPTCSKPMRPSTTLTRTRTSRGCSAWCHG